jgi:xylan 1,4-beta-xylosidase
MSVSPVSDATPFVFTGIVIQVDASQTEGSYTPVWNYFGADEPNYAYAPNGEKLLRELSALSPAPVYFRTHNLLTTGDGSGSLKWGSTNAYREAPDGSPIYDWTITDRIFDTFQAAHVIPLVEVGFMPEALSTHPQPYRHTFPDGDIFTGWSYPPKDYTKWSALVAAWVRHLHQRYDVSGWLWEVWNEPDIPYWHGTPEEYDKLYDVTVAAIRKELPQAKVGGPESTGPANDRAAAFLRQFLDHCAHGVNAATGQPGTPLDFISFHPKGSPKFVDGHVRMNVGAQLRSVQRGMQIVASFPEWRYTPIILGESDPEGCAACKGEQNGYRNGALYGVSVAEAIARTYELARRENVQLKGAVTWAFEFEDQPYFAGFRELATNGIDKPVLNVFRMLGMLGGDWIEATSSGAQPLGEVLANSVTAAPDVNAMATRKDREVDVLIWNYHDDDPAGKPAPVRLNVKLPEWAGLRHLPIRQAQIEIFRMDADHGNSFTAWQRMGSPQEPTPAEKQQLERGSRLEPTAETVKVTDNIATLNFEVPRQAVYLVRLKW